MSGYVPGSDAVLELEDNWETIAGDSIDAADRWIAKLFDGFEAVVGRPGIAERRFEPSSWP